MSDESSARKLLPVLRQRWSPLAFDESHEIDQDQVNLLLEAARRAPSAGNSQPWAFHATRRDDSGWEDVIACLAGSSRPWASQSSVLIVNISHLLVEDTDWEYSEFAAYDLGQAVAHLTIQAHSMGLSCRQFRAFDKELLSKVLDVPRHWEILTMTAVGRVAPQISRSLGASQRIPSVTWPRE